MYQSYPMQGLPHACGDLTDVEYECASLYANVESIMYTVRMDTFRHSEQFSRQSSEKKKKKKKKKKNNLENSCPNCLECRKSAHSHGVLPSPHA